jgi:uncharacterized radical SAM superfamily Fe-S cluster-containing enzyme
MADKPPERHISKTTSICPECNRVIGAEVFERDGKVLIRKECPEHGKVEEVYWSDYEMYKRAQKFARDGKGLDNPNVTKKNPVCPYDCGLCNLHKSHTALANIAVTNRCDLRCWYCFFYAAKQGYVYEPSLGQIREMVSILRGQRPVPCNAVQLTGGEPTLRHDLIDIVNICREEGIEHIQLNTNGIELSRNPGLAVELRKAGVNTIYLSFDGVTPESNPKNHWEIPQILDNFRKAGLGTVLVPTVIKGINDHEIGDILRFGFRNIDVVRSVNFQPVSLVGRMPKKERDSHRITIPDTIRLIEEQTRGQVRKDDFYPVPSVMPVTNFVEALTGRDQYALSSHFACGMGTYIFEIDGKMVPITNFVDVDGMFEYLDSLANEIRAGKSRYRASLGLLFKINSFIDKEKAPKGFGIGKIIYNALVKHNYKALGAFHYKSLFVGMMHFQDKFNYDIERVKRCCIHYAMTDGRIIPFCAFNVIPELYRDKSQESQGISFGKWKERTGRTMDDDLYHRDEKALAGTKLYKETYRFLKKG